MKDLFSSESHHYAKFRPTYPAELFDYIKSILPERNNAWDCGTGNGQVASELSQFIDHLFATDISQQQIDNAIHKENISYSVQPAETTDFEDDQFDLITVAQAIHWFDFDRFYKEVRRTAKKDAFLSIIGYSRLKISVEIDQIITHFYTNVIGGYWAEERKYIDQNYETIPFPFEEIETPKFEHRISWSLDHLLGYLNTWSAVKAFIQKEKYNPIDQLKVKIQRYWKEGEFKEVCFPILLRIGKI